MLRQARMACLTLAALTQPLLCVSTARADMFDVKGAEVSKGESELAVALAPQRKFPVNSDFVRLHGEATYGYGFTQWFKAGGKLGFELAAEPPGEDATYGGIETQAMLLDPRKGRLGLAWFTGLDVGFTRNFSETLTFGPLASLALTDKLSITINTLLQKNWAPDTPGLDFNYAWQVKRELADDVALGVEGYGLIPDFASAPSIDIQEHRLGPVIYLSGDLGRGAGPSKTEAAKGKEETAKLELQLGVLFGLTDATPGTTGRAKLAVTW